jgi:hydrogenase maturation protease
MNTLLIAGIGNIFLGDDAFGVEVARRLAAQPLPPEVRVVDFGIRGIDLAYALLEDYRRVILVDTVQRGGAPGSLYIIEPETESAGAMETHEMAPAKALGAAKAMGAALTGVVIVGCEQESFGSEEAPQMGLSRAVEAAVDQAVALIRAMAAEDLEAWNIRLPQDGNTAKL